MHTLHTLSPNNLFFSDLFSVCKFIWCMQQSKNRKYAGKSLASIQIMRIFASEQFIIIMINFKEIPEWWAICPNGQCTMAKDCLRHQAFESLPTGVTQWPCVLPNALNEGACPYYQSPRRILLASGFGNLYDKVRDRRTRHLVRIRLTDYLGSKGSYYRYLHGERLLTPEQQQWIQQLAKTYGNGEEVDFGDMKEGYDFKRHP